MTDTLVYDLNRLSVWCQLANVNRLNRRWWTHKHYTCSRLLQGVFNWLWNSPNLLMPLHDYMSKWDHQREDWLFLFSFSQCLPRRPCADWRKLFTFFKAKLQRLVFCPFRKNSEICLCKMLVLTLYFMVFDGGNTTTFVHRGLQSQQTIKVPCSSFNISI